MIKKKKNFIHPSADVSNKAKLGQKNFIWNNAQIRENASLGNGCVISKDVYIDKNVKIGNNCKIQNAVQIYDGVTIKNNVFIGPGVVFTNDYFPRANKKLKIKKTFVDSGVSIGANATIVCGLTIKKNAMIAAGSVLISDVKKNELYAGNPAKFKKKIK